MEISLLKEKLLQHTELSKSIKDAILRDTNKIEVFAISSERILSLYQTRLEINKDNKAYKGINFEITKILDLLKNKTPEMVTIISILGPTSDIGIFTDENTNSILGVLNFTNLGDRFYVLNPETDKK